LWQRFKTWSKEKKLKEGNIIFVLSVKIQLIITAKIQKLQFVELSAKKHI